MVPSFLGIIKMGIPYSDCCSGVSTSISTSHCSSFLKVSLLILGTKQYIKLNGLDQGFISQSTGAVSHLPSAVQTRSPKLSRSIVQTHVGLGMFLSDCFQKKQENRPSFQFSHLTRKLLWDLIKLKLVIVNTTNFRLVLGLLGGN